MKAHDRSYKIARTFGSATDLLNFRAARAVASNAHDSAKNCYIASRLNEAPVPEAKWREFWHLRVSGSTSPTPFHYFDVATLSIHFAANVNRHPPITESVYDTAVDYMTPADQDHQFCLRPVTDAEVFQTLNRSSTKAFGLDGISSQMLKLAVTTALSQFSTLLNFSIANATFPSE